MDDAFPHPLVPPARLSPPYATAANPPEVLHEVETPGRHDAEARRQLGAALGLPCPRSGVLRQARVTVGEHPQETRALQDRQVPLDIHLALVVC